MSNGIPRNLPASEIINQLSFKAEQRRDINFDFLKALNDFRQRVSDEVRFVNQLFPNYTPHDELYHLSRLFNIADKILGPQLIENLNATELLVLSLSLYGHDWGMAVSDPEKELIVENKLRDGHNLQDFTLLPNEHHKFLDFLKESRIEKVDSFYWQEYVRKTHAFRSGERIRNYFQKINSGLGELVARVSEAHWLNFKEIENNIDYPTNISALGEIVNLKAMALYLRLTDLLDLSQDRTPYIIWKYVSPQNIRSKMEWDKHRAIQSISFPSYQDGRIIQVDGSTNDNEIYAALTDLKNWCLGQLKNTNDILSQLNDSRYNLNIFDINWRIQARGFKPISIQFEFDRNRMFEILSDEIYQGDRYVFLRELIQNSIDAIRVRKEILERRGFPKSNLATFGFIEIHVLEDRCNGSVITIKDNGTGMDEYIVRNYLSIAGKSYYTSDDFKKLGLSLDPISKFGVGVLSCFMVSDLIQIETFREPYMSEKAEMIRINIPSLSQQFRIENSPGGSYPVGTTFKIFFSGRVDLDILQYLKLLLGYIEIPIQLTINSDKYLFIHPMFGSDRPKELFDNVNIVQHSFSYPWDQVFLPQSMKVAEEYFQELNLSIKDDLCVDDMEGMISYIEPKENFLIVKNRGHSWPGSDFLIKTLGEQSFKKRIQFNSNWNSYGRNSNEENNLYKKFGESVSVQPQFRVFINGICLPNAEPPKAFSLRENSVRFYSDPYMDNNHLFDFFCLPFISVNLNKKNGSNLDLARTKVLNDEENWGDIIWRNLKNYFKKEYLAKAMDLEGKKRLLFIAEVSFFKQVSIKDLFEIFEVGNIPVPVVQRGGKIAFIEWANFLDKNIYFQPYRFKCFDEDYAIILENEYPILNSFDWLDDQFILTTIDESDESSVPVLLSLDIVKSLVLRTHEFSSLHFSNTHKDLPPLVQQVWKPKQEIKPKVVTELLLQKATNMSESFTDEELSQLLYFFRGNIVSRRIDSPIIVNFGAPYVDYFSYGFEFLNIGHPNTKVFLAIVCTLLLAKENGSTEIAAVENLLDQVNDLPFSSYGVRYEGVDLGELNSQWQILIAETNQIFRTSFKIEFLTIGSFIPGSIEEFENKLTSRRIVD